METKTPTPQQENQINDEAMNGFASAADSTPVEPREVRRKNVTNLKKYLPYIKKEMLAHQEAFDKNFPGELDNFTEEETWELLDEENKTRRATFFKEVFRSEMYFTAAVQYIETNGKSDLLAQMNQAYTLEKLEEIKEKQEE